ncbi:metabolite transporter [Bacillaceae bacterium JMAK1]|nr:metabolite transporter [Bacillaceae bacterium JMAK1]
MATRSIEDLPLQKFHVKMFGITGGSAFIDGYVIGIIAIALSVFTTQFNVSSLMMGIVAASVFIGMFIGGTIGGYITDKIGRKKMFILDTVIILIVSVLQFFIGEIWHLVALRIILGVAIGADYPIAGSLMSEFSPKKHRGRLVGGIVALWFIGYAIAYVVGYFMLPLGAESWRFMLASCAIPAILLLIGRIGMPESPMWLASKGRVAEAHAIVSKVFGNNVSLPIQKAPKKAAYRDIFRNGYGKWTWFVSLFWTLQVAPAFAIGAFIPQILGGFGLADGNSEYLGSAIINLFYLIGLIPTLYLIERLGRRPTIIWPFLISAFCIGILGFTANLELSFITIILLFIVYGIFNTGMQVHQWVYPNELFPTEIRATAFGFATGFSRIGAAISTFIFPMILVSAGLQVTLYICTALFLIGFVLTLVMAPETKNMSLAEASSLNHSNRQKIGGKIPDKVIKG